jgi:hypothetical protein
MLASSNQNQVKSTRDDFVAAAKEVWSRSETVYRVFDTEDVRDGEGRRTGVAFTGADGRRRILHDPPSYRELHRLVKEASR